MWPSMAPFPIINSASIGSSVIASPAEKTHPKARFKSEYEKLLTIHSLTLYLNKIKMLALSFTTEVYAIHPLIQSITYRI
jgi:hypothetical protein